MVRTALIALLLASLMAKSANGARINTVPLHAHAPVRTSTLRRTHRPAGTISHGSRIAPTTQRKITSTTAHKSANARTLHAAPGRYAHRTSAPRYRNTSASNRAASLRRARFNRYRSGARFVPLVAAGPAASRSASATPNVERWQTVDSTQSGPVDPAAVPRSSPRPPESSATPTPLPAETDIAPTPGTDPATMAAAGNPLAAPRAARQPVGSIAGQVAELSRPPIFNGRVSSYTLRGTHDSLVRQNTRSEEEDLERIEDDADLQDRIAHGLLVHVPESGALMVNAALPEDRRYCRPWTANFLRDLARAHQSEFRTPIIVSSAVRTVEYQKQLMRTNHNAADAEGDIVSPHLTGGTIDIAKAGLSRREMLWMRNQLLGYQNAGVIDVEEEFRQRCFHITVYRNYVSPEQARRSPKAAPSPSAAATDPFSATPTADVAPNN